MLLLIYFALFLLFVAALLRWRAARFERDHALLPQRRRNGGSRVRLLE